MKVLAGTQTFLCKLFVLLGLRLGRQRRFNSSLIVDFSTMEDSTESQQSSTHSDPERKHFIEQKISSLQSQIVQLHRESGRQDETPLLITVSKKVPVMDIKVAYYAGLKHFAENYVQDLEQKIIQVCTVVLLFLSCR